MSTKIQLVLLIINFMYGFLTSFFTRLVNKYTSKEPIILKFLMNLVLYADLSFIYIYIIYKINYGIFNILYLFFFIFGFYIYFLIKKRQF